jgi:hypothetical protein
MANRYGDMQFVLRGMASIGIILFHVAMTQQVTDAFTGAFVTAVVHASLRVFFLIGIYHLLAFCESIMANFSFGACAFFY